MKIQLLLAASLLSLNVHASDSPFYLGVGIGETDFDDGGWAEKESYPIWSETDGQTYKVYGGFRLNQNIGFEGQYTSYADTVYGSPKRKGTITAELASYSLAANVGYQFDIGIRPFFTVGLGMVDLQTKSPFGSIDEQEVLMRLGGGVEYTHPALRQVTFRLAYEKDEFDITYRGVTESYSVASTYLGVSYNF
ncbi:outer membrane beta-barrel protein [Vibrio fortis]|uniref:outer membrane beta-barrel protein n=1 Tax=Vibrio fortis TaxID=212667 RepID=UPI0038CD2E90|tara:strand:+ start:464 stop:1042 length:579 start_codon:yes stop_codon:yes gene_type:complete